MAVTSVDYTGCTVMIYDADGYHLSDTVVTSYDKASLRIEVLTTPKALDIGDACRLLILSAPTPFEYLGRVIKEGSKKAIAMYKGQEKESRGAMRYAVSYPAIIENLICDDRAYPLHTPLKVVLVNISKSGVRFRTQFYALSVGDRVQFSMKVSGNIKRLMADVTNFSDNENATSEYGCRFLITG